MIADGSQARFRSHSQDYPGLRKLTRIWVWYSRPSAVQGK